jgi:hypothetical protein
LPAAGTPEAGPLEGLCGISLLLILGLGLIVIGLVLVIVWRRRAQE